MNALHREPSAAQSRRAFLQKGVAFSLGFGGLGVLLSRHGNSVAAALAAPAIPGAAALSGRASYGELVRDPLKILDLPAGFSYRVISRAGGRMADGLVVPGRPDGMAAFPGPDGLTLLVRNHETEADWVQFSPFGQDNALLSAIDQTKLYDAGQGRRPSLGGCTTLVYDTKMHTLQREFLSLAGTNRNCAGGPTPWGSWLTCEEDDVREGEGFAEKHHGYVFEVPATARSELVTPLPIKAMGRFVHEAVAIDPRSGIVYLSEDSGDGLLYRYIPTQRENLLVGGRLQALVIADQPSCDTSNNTRATIARGTRLKVRWIDLDEIDSPNNDLRKRGFAKGAASFARGEGMWWGNDSVYFAATTGGSTKKGQIWRYVPSVDEGTSDEQAAPGELELFVEPNDGRIIENADNVTVAPWGDLFVCEDSATTDVSPSNRLLRITPAGEVSTFAWNAASESEFAGVCFSPDGSTMFVNVQGDGLTLAVTGAW